MRQFLAFASVAFSIVACSSEAPFYPAAYSRNLSADSRNAVNSDTELPLRTLGRFIVDGRGHRVKLAAVNWYGASDAKLVVGGLDKAPLAVIVDRIKQLGFNSVRLPYSNMMLHSTRVDAAAVAANPELLSLTPLEIYDRVITSLTDAGVYVVINNHTTHPIWCCNFDDDGLWYTYDYSEEQWLEDWAMMAKRYSGNRRVIAADLRNEVRIARKNRSLIPNVPTWGKNGNDWRQAAEKAAARVLNENPDMLVIVEGINFPREHLQGVAANPIRLQYPDRLVYAAHNYGFIAPGALGKKYGEMAEMQLRDQLEREWGYVIAHAKHYTAPVWVSEFGDSFKTTDRKWFTYFVNYLRDGDFDFAYWALNPSPKASGEEESFGLLEDDWLTPLDDWRTVQLRMLLKARLGPGIEPGWEDAPQHHFSVLAFSDWDSVQSADRQDWFPNAYKARCREGERLVGLSSNWRGSSRVTHAALCSDYGLSVSVSKTQVVANNITAKDGAVTRVECPEHQYVIGAAQTLKSGKYKLEALLCAASAHPLGASCRIRDFIKEDNRATEVPGDWDAQVIKGQCDLNEYIAGVEVYKGGARSIICCH